MKVVVVSLLSIMLMFSCSSRCDAKGEGETPESPPQRKSGRAEREIPTDPQEIRTLVRRYLSPGSSEPYQEANVLRRLDTQVIPYLIEAAVAENGKSQRVYGLLRNTLVRLSNDARSQAAPKLLQTLTDENTSIDLANGILDMIDGLGRPGLIIESDLIELRRTRPELERSINSALVGIGSDQGGRILVERLVRNPNEWLLDEVGAYRRYARDTGPEVMKLLSHPNWKVRLAAAETLWRIGYTEAIPALIEALNDPTDVRLNRMAAEALGRVGAQSAVEALKETAANHWHPAVRDKAKDALEHIASRKPYEAKLTGRERFSEFMDRSYWGINSSTQKKPEFLQEPLDLKLHKSTPWKLSYTSGTVVLDNNEEAEQGEVKEKLRGLSYTGETSVLGSNDEAEQREAKEKGATIVVGEDGMVEYRMPVERVPDVALRMENGWLVGSDRGEFGGELVFVPDEGEQTFVLRDNVDDLFTLGGKTIAITGLSHMTIHYGCVYEIKPTESGQWVAELWRTLPGAPKLCGKLPSGEIFISTSGGGDVILSPDGTFRMAAP